DNYVLAASSSLANIGYGDFTFEARINGIESLQAQHPMIFSNRPSVGTGCLFFFVDLWGGSSYKMLGLQLNQNANYFLINNGTFNGNILDGACHHVAISRKVDTISFYVDGLLIGTKGIWNTNPTVATSSDLLLGKDTPTNNTFNGIISEIRIWEIARTQVEIANNMNTNISASAPGLVGYWKLNDGFGQTAIDQTGNANGQLGNNNGVDSIDPEWSGNCCVSPIGIPNFNINENEAVIFPNPNQGQFSFSFDNTSQVSVEIYGIQGQKVFEKICTGTTVNIDITSQPKGIYLVRLVGENIQRIQKVVIF
ncbi:MAG: T9SS type A sorting domain-containing protein, partial [Flavobacteriales bacterium]|nr:T9SS type A sorting domain-containing protein [Flavobacteriales bacterium]